MTPDRVQRRFLSLRNLLWTLLGITHWVIEKSAGKESHSILFAILCNMIMRVVLIWLQILMWASFIGRSVKNLPAVQQTWFRSLSWEDLLEKEMATHSSILAWKIPRTEEPDGLWSIGFQRVRHDWVTNTLLVHILICMMKSQNPEAKKDICNA